VAWKSDASKAAGKASLLQIAAQNRAILCAGSHSAPYGHFFHEVRPGGGYALHASPILIALSSQQRIPARKLLIFGSAFNIWHFIQQRMLCLEAPGRDRRAAQGGHKTYRVCEEGPLSAENDVHRRSGLSRRRAWECFLAAMTQFGPTAPLKGRFSRIHALC
jgi:hypothetical protein